MSIKEQVGVTHHEKVVFSEDTAWLAEVAQAAAETLLDDLDIDELVVEPFVEIIPDYAGGSIDLLGLRQNRTGGRLEIRPEPGCGGEQRANLVLHPGRRARPTHPRYVHQGRASSGRDHPAQSERQGVDLGVHPR